MSKKSSPLGTCDQCGFPIWSDGTQGRHTNPQVCISNLRMDLERYRDDHRAAMAAWDLADALYDIPETVKILSTMVGEDEALRKFLDRLHALTDALDEIDALREADDHADRLIGLSDSVIGELTNEQVRQRILAAMDELAHENSAGSATSDPSQPKES